MKKYRNGFEFRAVGVCVAVSWGWRWRWFFRRDEGLKMCLLGVLLEVGRWSR